MTRSIRFRITAMAVLAVLTVLVVASVTIALTQRRLLTDSLDESIEQEVDEIEGLVAADQLPVVLTALGDDDAEGQVVADGEVIASSANLAGLPPLGPAPTATASRQTIEGPSGESMRLVSRRVAGQDRATVIYVAGTLGDVQESTRTLMVALAAVVPALLLLLGALIWWLVGRTLRPVESIRAEVASIGGHDLHRRVPTLTTGDEIARLAATMNDMLERLDEAAHRQDRFVADASHELRSPLTRMRAELEVDLALPEEADLLATQRSVLEETVGLQHLVDDLLHLARRDASGAAEVRHGPVDLDDILLRVARRWRTDARMTIDTTGVGPAQVVGDGESLTRAIANLVDNAVRHANATVLMRSEEHEEFAVVSVTDDGPGIPASEQERIFERFTRLDEARHGGTGGTGLGLAIAREIAEQHGGSLMVDPEYAPGARLVLILPVNR